MTNNAEEKDYLGHRKRLRTRFLKASNLFEDYELLELMLSYVFAQADTKPIAKALLKRFENIRGVFDASDEELTSVDGVGDGVITFIKMFREIWFRYEESPLREKNLFLDQFDVARAAKIRMQALPIEEVWVAFLDSKYHLIRWDKVSEGTSTATTIYPIKIAEMAIANKASAIFLAHNHPSSDYMPSVQDVTLTERVRTNCHTVGIHLIDHIIVSENGAFSIMQDRIIINNG